MNQKLLKIFKNLKSIRGIYRFNIGYCTLCESTTLFVSLNRWLRDNYVCVKCLSIPRQRAIIHVLKNYCDNYTTAKIHESSPSGPTFDYLKKHCENYTYSHFFSKEPLGKNKGNVRNESLECLSFDDNSFDIFITQDVFEHLYNPCIAFKEISRVLRTGGVHLFTVPYYLNMEQTEARISILYGVNNSC